jgi:hypothetical protein|uniref:Uncharacterized protein n=1 Tax=viral metagenome TaxID=1070528 RepID=A0A6C0K880_9ZZZZ
MRLNKMRISSEGALLLLVAIFLVLLPYIRNVFAPAFPEGFRDVDCKGVTCDEGEFCKDNTCHSVTAPKRSCGREM